MQRAHVSCRREGRLGRITLTREHALNALDLSMMRAMGAALTGWLEEGDVELVVLDSADERAFCAGGDITVVHASATGDPEIARELWRTEYALDALIATYPIPVLVLMDGITMGGGVGLGCHAAHRVVTERSVLAMPEVALGLAPDVGGCLLLSRAPGEWGTHLALTGARIGARDALACGLADHFVPSNRLAALVEAVRQGGDPLGHVLGEFAQEAPRGAADLEHHTPWIDACYAAESVEEIRARLGAYGAPAAAAAAAALDRNSPTALKVTLRALRAAGSMTTLEECLAQDYRLCGHFLQGADLPEGIRATVLDKDRRPQWSPAELGAVTPETVDRYFQPLDVPDFRVG